MTFKKSFKVGIKAQQYFEGPDALPVTWLRRKEDPDFYVDYVVEIDEDNGPSGLKFAVQLRGTDRPRIRDGSIKHRLRTKNLTYYVDRSSDPVFLVVVDTRKGQGYWVHVQDWAKEEDGWRGQKSVTVDVPLANRLEDTEAFRCAIERAVRNSRSTAIAAVREAKSFERLDNRFKVRVEHVDGITHIELNPVEKVEGRVRIRGPHSAEKFSQLFEKGELTKFEAGEFSIEGSELFRHIIDELASGTISVHAAKKIPCHVSILTADSRGEEDVLIGSIPAMLIVGTKEMHFEVKLDNAPLAMRCSLRMNAANRLEMGQFNLAFAYEKWLGQDLLFAAHFDQVHRVLKTFTDGRPINLQCEIHGNLLFKSSLTSDDPTPFQAAEQVLELLSRARSVARHLDLNPPMPRLEDIEPAEDDVLYLWELIENGEASATVCNASGELEMIVRDLQSALRREATGGTGLAVQALERCPPLFGCRTQKWALQRSIPVHLTTESARLLAIKRDESERIAVRVEAKPGATCATILIPAPPPQA